MVPRFLLKLFVSIIFDFYSTIQIKARENAPIAPSTTKYSVIIFSHGFMAH